MAYAEGVKTTMVILEWWYKFKCIFALVSIVQTIVNIFGLLERANATFFHARRLARNAFMERNVTGCRPQRKTAEPECKLLAHEESVIFIGQYFAAMSYLKDNW